MFDKSDTAPDTPLFEHIDAINASITQVRSYLKEHVDISSIDDMPMIRSQVEIFFQAHFRRALSFLDGGKHAIDAGHGLLAITSIRCIYESAACIHDFATHVFKLVDAGNLADAVRLAHRRTMAQRFAVKEMNWKDYDYTAVNILKQIDAMDKDVPNARRDYDQLSEFVHPNSYGSIYYFLRPSEENVISFGSPIDERTQLMGLFLQGASLFRLMNSDYLWFMSVTARLMANELQERIDDYERRKSLGLTGDKPPIREK